MSGMKTHTHGHEPKKPFSRRRFIGGVGLPTFVAADARSRAALADIGKPGGLLDARDPLEEGPIRLITRSTRRVRRSSASSSTTT
jgi:hypothetical protein